MRLAEFISANVEPILAEWEAFARGIWPEGTTAEPAELRDDAEAILLGTVQDMRSRQSAAEQDRKSKGAGEAGPESVDLTRASSAHGSGRMTSGFDFWAVVAEYRALRAGVLRLWRESGRTPDLSDLDDLTRFNESIDQSLTNALRSHAQGVERGRLALAAEQARAGKPKGPTVRRTCS